MKSLRVLLLPLLALLAFLAPAHAAAPKSPYPTPTGYIDDFAHVLTDSTRTSLEAQAVDIYTRAKARVFLVTVPTLSGADVKDYAINLALTWKIGEKSTDRGVLILFCIQEHRYRFEIGSGLEGILNDAKVGDMGRAIVPSLKQSDYDQAATTALTDVDNVILTDAGLPLYQDPNQVPDQASLTTTPASPDPSADHVPFRQIAFPLLMFFLFGIFAMTIFFYIVRAFGRRSSGSLGPGSSSSSDFGSSSSSDTSSDSSSSSSDSFSGGDGGDFSGGGADGSW